MSASFLQFPFNCNINLRDYRKLLQSALETQRTQFATLKRMRTVGDISSFLGDLNDFDLMRHNQDISGVAWHVVHPDTAFREQTGEAQKAFTVFDADITTSSALADNLALYETTISFSEEIGSACCKNGRDSRQGRVLPTLIPRKRRGCGS